MLRRRDGSRAASRGLERETVASLCGVCPAGCAVEVELEAGRIVRQRPRPGHPHGVVCPRGAKAADIVYSPDRILYPQLRKGGVLAQATWPDVYEHIVARIRAIAAEYGPEAVCTYTGRGNFELGLNEAFAPANTRESSANAVLFPFGSPNATGVGSLCYAAYGMLATRATFGGYMRDVGTDIEGANLILVWGANPVTDSPPTNVRRLKEAQRRGARVVVIDHRRSETCRVLGAQWIGVRPGTDGALALGILHLLIRENRIDHAFVRDWTHGFDELRAYAEAFTPERVEAITGVPRGELIELAAGIGETDRCAVLMYSGLEYSNCGVQAIRAVWCIQALTGHLDVPGGNYFLEPNRTQATRILTERPISSRPPIGAREHPAYCDVRQEAHAALLPRAILEGEPYPVRALIISGSSLLTSWPNPTLWRRAFAALDLLVVINRFPTADAEYAHVVLPAATGFETESYVVYRDGRLQLRRKVIEPLGESKNDYLIFAELASALGYGWRWPQTEEGLIRHALEGTGVTLEELRQQPEGVRPSQPKRRHRKWESGLLRPDGTPGFDTPTGKVELASEWLRSYGYDAVAAYQEPSEGPIATPGLARRYPLVLNTGARTQYAFRSQHLNVPSLARREPQPRVTLHPEDARGRGICDGDPVWVSTARGQVPFVARVRDDVVRGAVECNMGGGGPLGPEAWRRCNVNELTDLDNRDPISGFPVYKALLCEVRRRQE